MRDRGYYRKQRKKHIKRKKKLDMNISGGGYACEYPGYYEHDGQYSKGKIHCSCWLCSSKTNSKKLKCRNNWKHSDLLKLLKLKNQLDEMEH